MPVYHNPLDVRSRLARHGVDYDDIVEAVLRGHATRSLGNELHPSNYKGNLFHANTVEGLRDILLSQAGWEMDEPKNLSITFNHGEDVCIVVASGNNKTGNPYKDPKTRSKKGAFLEAAVAQNTGEIPQRELFETEAEYLERVAKIEAKQAALSSKNVFYLLIHSNDGVPVAELSRPIAIDDGWVTAWKERYILDLTIPRGGDADDDEFDIPVTMK